MTDSTSAYKIKILDGEASYPVWAIRMVDILTDLDLDEYVMGMKTTEPAVTTGIQVIQMDGTTTTPNPPVTENHVAQWKRCLAHVHHTLYSIG